MNQNKGLKQQGEEMTSEIDKPNVNAEAIKALKAKVTKKAKNDINIRIFQIGSRQDHKEHNVTKKMLLLHRNNLPENQDKSSHKERWQQTSQWKGK